MISLGEELKREREFREISLREISDATKINVRILEAIEKDDYSILPGGIFNRNFIRAYAQFIGLDPEIAVRKYLVQASDVTEQKYPASKISSTSKDLTSSRPVRFYVILGALLTIALLLIVWFYRSEIPLVLRKSGSFSIGGRDSLKFISVQLQR